MASSTTTFNSAAAGAGGEDKQVERKGKIKNIIIPLGSLHKITHSKSGAAFIGLSKQKGDGSLNPDELGKRMADILKLDDLFKAGQCNESQFRAGISNILGLADKLSDDEFDLAWNAMQGDLKEMVGMLQEATEKHGDLKFVLVSNTSPIHLKNITQSTGEKIGFDNKTKRLSLLNIPLFASYLVPTNQEKFSATNVYDYAVTQLELNPTETAIIVQFESNSAYALTKTRDEKAAAARMPWAEKLDIAIIPHTWGANIANEIEEYLTPNKSVNTASAKGMASSSASSSSSSSASIGTINMFMSNSSLPNQTNSVKNSMEIKN